MDAYKAKELVIIHPDKLGVGANVYGVVSDAGVNLQAICGYTTGKQAVLTMVAENNPKAKRALKKAGVSVDERAVVCVSVPNQKGIFQKISKCLADGGINIDYAYASVGAKTKALVVLQTSDDPKAISELKKLK